jgi:NADPH:quinone reductase-like Zn-dependent oxidoreductase
VLPELIALTGEPSAVLSIADFSAPALGARVSTMGAGSAVPALEEAARLWAAGRFRLPVAQTFPLAEAAAAQSANARGHVLGKYVVLVG